MGLKHGLYVARFLLCQNRKSLITAEMIDGSGARFLLGNKLSGEETLRLTLAIYLIFDR